jgi:two-component system, response regulator PdtaR
MGISHLSSEKLLSEGVQREVAAPSGVRAGQPIMMQGNLESKGGVQIGTVADHERALMPLASPATAHISPLVLIVEDDPFVALDLEETLRREGYYVLGPAASISSALALLQHAEPDVAVLDFNLNGKEVTPVAQVLADSHVPFVMASGSPEPFEDEVLSHVRNLGKPTDKHALLAELERLLVSASP